MNESGSEDSADGKMYRTTTKQCHHGRSSRVVTLEIHGYNKLYSTTHRKGVILPLCAIAIRRDQLLSIAGMR